MIICYDHFMLVQFAHVRIRQNDYSLELPALGRPEANLGNPVQRCAQDVTHAVSMQPAGSSSLGLFSCPYSPECVERLYEKSSQADQPPQHEATHGSIYERFPARTQPLVIFAHPPILVDPRKCPLYYPPTWQHLKALRGQ